MLLLDTYRVFVDNVADIIHQCPEISTTELLAVLRGRHRDAVQALERLKPCP
jgi:hypothetical protein